MADGGEEPWGDTPPFHAPVFVVTHRPRAVLERLGGTSFTYVTDGIASAIEQARTAANGKNIELTPIRVVNGEGVTHIKYQVNGRAGLGTDYRVAELTAA